MLLQVPFISHFIFILSMPFGLLGIYFFSLGNNHVNFHKGMHQKRLLIVCQLLACIIIFKVTIEGLPALFICSFQILLPTK